MNYNESFIILSSVAYLHCCCEFMGSGWIFNKHWLLLFCSHSTAKCYLENAHILSLMLCIGDAAVCLVIITVCGLFGLLCLWI